jgi:hypothetical protein
MIFPGITLGCRGRRPTRGSARKRTRRRYGRLETARRPPVTRSAPPAWPRLRALAADLPRLWDSATTSHRDRKRLLRSLIAGCPRPTTTASGLVSAGTPELPTS